MFINMVLFGALGIVLGCSDIGLTDWQYWAILVLTEIIYVRAKLEVDNEKR